MGEKQEGVSSHWGQQVGRPTEMDLDRPLMGSFQEWV